MFYYLLSDLCSVVRVTAIPLVDMYSAITNAGYRVSNTHKEPLAIKTDAPNVVVWDIIRAYAKL